MVALTPTQPACVGDCDGNHQVVIGEVLTALSFALGDASKLACHVSEPGGNTTVLSVVKAMRNALNECPVSSVLLDAAPPLTAGTATTAWSGSLRQRINRSAQ